MTTILEPETKKDGALDDPKQKNGEEGEERTDKIQNAAAGESEKQENGGGGDREKGQEKLIEEELTVGNKNWRYFLLTNPIISVHFQYLLLGVAGLVAFFYTGLSVGGGFSKEWNMKQMYRHGFVYMLLISGLLWLNILTKWLLLYFYIGHTRTTIGGKCLKAFYYILILFYALILFLLVLLYLMGMLLPMIKAGDPTYEKFDASLHFLVPFLIHGVIEAIFLYYWSRQVGSHQGLKPIVFMLNPYF